MNLTVESTDQGVLITVMDENPRIPEMERSVIVEEEKLGPLYHGSGMGLWLVSLIVDYTDGTLEFEPKEPRGNIVSIRLRQK